MQGGAMTEQDTKNARLVQRRTIGGRVHRTQDRTLQAPVWRDGLWTRPGLPTFGWTCVAVEPAPKSQNVCMACNKAFDGPSHLLQHQSYSGRVRVDPTCSSNMQRSAAAAHASPASVITDRAAKRGRWLDRAWKRNAEGQSVLTSRQFQTIVSFTGRTWSFTVRPKTTDVEWDQSGFRSCDEAKLAAFDEITKRLKEQASQAVQRTSDEA